MKVLGVIPARYDSSRFPGKPLAKIDGKTMIRRVYEQCLKSSILNKVVVATDDDSILSHIKSWNGNVVMTSRKHKSGTERCFEALALQDNGYDIVVNIQGDEPFIDPTQINHLLKAFSKKETQIASLAKKIHHKEEVFDRNTVKVVMDHQNKALYFSRASIPFSRDENFDVSDQDYFKHIGIYAYKSEILKEICQLPLASLEAIESLEQLRWLTAGYNIFLQLTDKESISIDTPEDLSKLTNII
jgi:3-deoxy-manno-octulosonate cytidylyltransferase (CMP-KDO synthetase)